MILKRTDELNKKLGQECEKGNTCNVLSLIKDGADNFDHGLIMACRNNNDISSCIDSIKIMISHGAKFTNIAMTLACAQQNYKAVVFLLPRNNTYRWNKSLGISRVEKTDIFEINLAANFADFDTKVTMVDFEYLCLMGVKEFTEKCSITSPILFNMDIRKKLLGEITHRDLVKSIMKY